MSKLEDLKGAATAHMLEKIDLRPTGTEKIFSKLSNLNESALKIIKSMNDMVKAHGELENQLKEIRGGCLVCVDIITDSMSEDDIYKYGTAYAMKEREAQNNMIRNNMVPSTKAPPKKQAPDMAGDTVSTKVS